MENLVIETTYPITFRQDDARVLGKYLQAHHSVVLIGMKRVGISNFLRFFLNHKDIIPTYISKTDKHLFVPVDLNDLVEREIFPFWMLTLKRTVDEATRSPFLDKKIKKEIEAIFLESIQSKDLFFLIDTVRKVLLAIIQSGVFPGLFFLRFDRMKDAITSEFFDNLQGLKDATHQRMSYIFTGYRGLATLAPAVFTKSALSLFAHDMYVKPAKREDIEIVCSYYQKQNEQELSIKTKEDLLDIADGYVQYLLITLILLRERKISFENKEELFAYLVGDEQINLQSDELWESLDLREQDVLTRAVKSGRVNEEDKKPGKYLWDTGVLTHDVEKETIFSPLFSYYVKQKVGKKLEQNIHDFTKKEYLLFQFLQEHIDTVCEREKIIESVWKDAESLGVSDWAIDRLVARVRSKLKRQQSEFEIQTVKTRGYKLISNKEV